MPATKERSRVRSRRPRSGPERELVRAALERGLPHPTRFAQVVFEEPEIATGFPDLVIAHTSRRKGPGRSEGLAPSHARLLYHMYCSGGGDLTEIREALFWPRRFFEGVIEDLLAADLVRVRNEFVHMQRLETVFALRRLVAIEAKIDNWKDAMEQAVANLWFASHSYVLLPHLPRTKGVLERAKAWGIGILVLGELEVEIALEASEHALPASYGSWLFNTWAVQALAGGHE